MCLVIIKLMVDSQLVTIFLNHLSLVNHLTFQFFNFYFYFLAYLQDIPLTHRWQMLIEGYHEYMGCGRFFVLHVNTNLLQHYHIGSL